MGRKTQLTTPHNDVESWIESLRFKRFTLSPAKLVGSLPGEVGAAGEHQELVSKVSLPAEGKRLGGGSGSGS